MRIMVTGHAGYLGSVVTQRLHHAHEVVGIDAGYFSDPASPQGSRRDIRDLAASDLGGFDAIVHLAALSNDACSEINPDVCRDVNESQAVRLALSAKQHGVARFVFASTCSIYGARGAQLAHEDDAAHPLSVYAATKHRAEIRINALAGDGFVPVALRFATLFGVAPNMRTDLVLNRMTASAVTRGRIELNGDGTSYRPLLHVQDAAAAVEAVITANLPSSSGCFNVAAATGNIQIRQIAQMVSDVIPGINVTVLDGRHDPRSYAADPTRLSRAGLNFDSDLHHEISKLADYFTQRGDSYEELTSAPSDRATALTSLAARQEIGADLRWTSTTHQTA